MSPRPYRLGKRQAASEQTRSRIIAATRELIMTGRGVPSVDSVAELAGVARMTVYYQFGSKVGLLEAVYDDLATRGLVSSLPAVFEAADALEALDELVAAFGRFWASDRLIMRRLRALAVLDPDFEGARARDERRRNLFQNVVGRIAEQYGQPNPASAPQLVDVFTALASFETFDAIAGENRSPEELVPVVQRLVRLALGIEGAPSDGR